MAENSGIERTHHIDRNATGRRLGAYKTAARRTGVSLSEWFDLREQGQKWCFACKLWKPADVFAVDVSRAGGRTSRCRACASEASTASRYGLTRQQLADMREASEGLCSICGESADLVVDHQHACGTVRGLLCDTCNRGLGMFGDDPNRLRAAATYIEAKGRALDGVVHDGYPEVGHD